MANMRGIMIMDNWKQKQPIPMEIGMAHMRAIIKMEV